VNTWILPLGPARPSSCAPSRTPLFFPPKTQFSELIFLFRAIPHHTVPSPPGPPPRFFHKLAGRPVRRAVVAWFGFLKDRTSPPGSPLHLIPRLAGKARVPGGKILPTPQFFRFAIPNHPAILVAGRRIRPPWGCGFHSHTPP